MPRPPPPPVPRPDRRRLLTGLAACVSAGPVRSARPPRFRLRFAHNQPPSHPLNLRLLEVAAAVRAASDGDVAIDLYPANQLGSDLDLLRQVRAGALDGFLLSGLILSALTPVAAISGMPFAFAGPDAVWRALDGDLGALIRREVAATGLLAFDRIWDNGFRQITSSRGAVHSVDDLQGFRIRVPVARLWTSLFSALGAAPSSIHFAEVYTALQTGAVDGQENALTVIRAARLAEVQAHCALTNHMWDGLWCLVNQARWAALPMSVQQLVRTETDAAALRQRADIAALNPRMRAQLEAAGMRFTQPPSDTFRQRLRAAGFYRTWRDRLGADAWGTLERSVGAIA